MYGSPAKKGLLDDNDDSDDGSVVEVVYLPTDFTPGPNDVVCARGKSFWDHEGNKKYRTMIANATEKYASTTNKLEKTLIVSEIVDAVRKKKGKFVKQERRGAPWVKADEIFAREKVGQSLRDGLHDRYKSSTKAKKRRRSQATEKLNDDIDRVIQSNVFVSQRMEELSREVEQHGDIASDFSIMTMFSRANSDILETIKRDTTMLERFQSASSIWVEDWRGHCATSWHIELDASYHIILVVVDPARQASNKLSSWLAT